MKSRRTWLRRLLIGLALLVLVAEVGYVIAANAFLASEWGRARMNRRPDRFHADYERARTWLPGRVQVRGLDLAGASRRSRWRVTVEAGEVRFALTPLLRREFRLTTGTADGAAIEVDLLPVPEAARPARRPGAGWLVTLGDIEARGVGRFRLGEHVIEGEGRLAGGAAFQARGDTEIELTDLTFESSRFLEAEEVLAEKISLSASVAIAPFDAVEDHLEDVLAGISATVKLDAETESLGFLAAYLGQVPWLEIGGRGHLIADLEVTRGWLAPHSRIVLTGPVVGADYFGLEARGAGRLEGAVAQDGSHVTIDVELDDYSVIRPRDGATLLEGRGLVLRVRNDSTAIDRPASGVELSIDVAGATLPDLVAIDGLVPRATGLRLTGGSARLEGGMTYRARDRTGEGWLKLKAPRVAATYGDVDLRSTLTVDAHLTEARLEDGVFDISGSHLFVGSAEVRRGGELRDQGWWGRVDIPGGTLSFDLGAEEPGPAEIEGRIAAKLRDSGPVVALVADRVQRLGWLDRVLDVEDVEAVTDVRTRGERMSLVGLEVKGGRREGLEIRAELDLDERRPLGVFFARWGRLGAAVELAEQKRRWHVARPRQWYETRAAEYRAVRAAP